MGFGGFVEASALDAGQLAEKALGWVVALVVVGAVAEVEEQGPAAEVVVAWRAFAGAFVDASAEASVAEQNLEAVLALGKVHAAAVEEIADHAWLLQFPPKSSSSVLLTEQC